MRNNLIYHIRSHIFQGILLGLFPQKTRPHPRNRMHLTPNRNLTIKPIFCPSPKHRSTSSIRSISNMSTPRIISKPQPRTNLRTISNSNTRDLLHLPTGNRIPRNLIQLCRQSIRLIIFHCHWIPWTSCPNWILIPHSMFTPSNSNSIIRRTPLRIRSSCLILTLR